MKALFITAATLLFSAGAYAAGITIDTSATNTDISAVTGSITIDGSAIGGGGGGGEAAFTAESTPGTTPTATGTDAIGIGDGAIAGDAAGDNAVLAIGAGASAIGVNAIAIGQFSDATGSGSIAIGGDPTDANSADATGLSAIAIGHNSLSDADNTISIGSIANASAALGVAIGAFTFTSGTSAIAIGNSSIAQGIEGIAIGRVASAGGHQSISIGRSAVTVTGSRQVAIGYNTDASGENCIAIGGNVTDTDSADCSAADSVAIGQHILADDIGEFAFASGEFAVQSDAHRSWYVLRNQTTDATETELFADASAGDISVGSDCSMSGFIRIVARRTDADGETAHYTIEWTIDNNAGTTALVGAVSVVTVAEDTAAWSVTATADNSNDGINILVTGEASKTIRWVGAADVTYVCG